MISLAQYITTCRSLVSDTGTGRMSMIRSEVPSGIMDGSNKRLTIQFYPVVSGSFTLRKNQAVMTPTTDYSVDLNTGIITLVVAGNFNSDRFDCDYQFYWYTDADYHEFIYAAGGHVGITGDGADAAIRAQSVLNQSTVCLLDAIRQFVGYHFNIRRAQEYADKFNASAGGVSVNVDVVTKNFRDLANAFFDRGIQMRDDCYKGHGGRERPAANVRNFNMGPRYQPQR